MKKFLSTKNILQKIIQGQKGHEGQCFDRLSMTAFEKNVTEAKYILNFIFRQLKQTSMD